MPGIDLTWTNLLVMAGLLSTILTGLVAGTGAMVEWRLTAIQRQLTERMNLYQREMDQVESRLEKLEHKP
jgi:hypothetical protein